MIQGPALPFNLIWPTLCPYLCPYPVLADKGEQSFRSLNDWALQVKKNPALLTEDMIACKNQAGNDKMNLFNWANQFLQSAVDLAEATEDLCRRLVSDHHVVYAEVRFCPTLHIVKGLTELQATEAVIRGFKAAGIAGGIIVCALRTMPEQHWHDMVQLA